MHPHPLTFLLQQLRQALNLPDLPFTLSDPHAGSLPSCFPVSDLAAASLIAAGTGMAARLRLAGRDPGPFRVDWRRASLWFQGSVTPVGWTLPAAWDAVAGDYATADGWIRLHTNAPHHRAAALKVLGAPADRDAVAARVAQWSADALEQAVVEAGGCAAAMRSRQAWAAHPQGAALAAEPLVWVEEGTEGAGPAAAVEADRPLAGIRVLDLTRVLAGPVATRFLASYGASVRRIDPPDWDEPGVLPDVTPGKHRARLDLKQPEDRARLEQLLAGADILVHGYRPDALDRLGLGAARRQAIRPGLIDVSLSAYGWTGPWAGRRGFDSLVQMSTGIAQAGMDWKGSDRPQPLPVQALDYATGYLLAACALHGLNHRTATGRGSRWRTSLARMAALLTMAPAAAAAPPLTPAGPEDHEPDLEMTGWGPVHRLRPALDMPGARAFWDRPAGPLGTDAPAWTTP